MRLRDIVLPHILAHREHFALALASELMDKHICAFLVSLFGELDEEDEDIDFQEFAIYH